MLTQSQRKTYHFVKKFIHLRGYSPTAAEIATGIGISSRGVVHRYLKALADERLIYLMPKRHRNIQLIDENTSQAPGLPVLGVIAAGRPIEAIEQQETIDLSSIFLGESRFALKVAGDSMIEEGIFDGDLVVCEQNDSADNGQIVVALVDSEEATLKRLQKNNDGTVTLIPANQHLDPMIYSADRVQVQGIYVGLLRFSV